MQHFHFDEDFYFHFDSYFHWSCCCCCWRWRLLPIWFRFGFISLPINQKHFGPFNSIFITNVPQPGSDAGRQFWILGNFIRHINVFAEISQHLLLILSRVAVIVNGVFPILITYLIQPYTSIPYYLSWPKDKRFSIGLKLIFSIFYEPLWSCWSVCCQCVCVPLCLCTCACACVCVLSVHLSADYSYRALSCQVSELSFRLTIKCFIWLLSLCWLSLTLFLLLLLLLLLLFFEWYCFCNICNLRV